MLCSHHLRKIAEMAWSPNVLISKTRPCCTLFLVRQLQRPDLVSLSRQHFAK